MPEGYNISIKNDKETSLDKETDHAWQLIGERHVNHFGRVFPGHDQAYHDHREGTITHEDPERGGTAIVRLNEEEAIAYWRPKHDEHWYDLGQLQTYSLHVLLNMGMLEQLLAEGPDPRTVGPLQEKLRRLESIYEQVEQTRNHPERYDRISLPDDAPDIRYTG
ncbi:hypothetical protein JXA12_01760 [Candidatus Woesearchaeota archaeon]|nr:hypothetical protein [Candidatus Woesearchaeota archaeon]